MCAWGGGGLQRAAEPAVFFDGGPGRRRGVPAGSEDAGGIFGAARVGGGGDERHFELVGCGRGGGGKNDPSGELRPRSGGGVQRVTKPAVLDHGGVGRRGSISARS